MNPKLIGDLIQLRYQLMWARTRTRNGKIALFVIGYLLLVLVIATMAAGGFGAAAVAVRSGKAELVTRIVLTSLFAQALLGTVMMGFGLNSIFSDVELRRYPVSAADRKLARHLIGIIDPFWILTFALELGLVFGLYVWGGPGSFVLGFMAVLLLFPANYLVARVIETVISRAMQGPSGSTFVMIGVLALSLSGLVIPPVVKRFPWLVDATLAALAWTPPFGAAAAATQSGGAVASGLGLEMAWIVALAAALVWLEGRPVERRTVETTAMRFETGYDKVASALGFAHAPLIGWWLRFYCRNSRFKAMLVIAPVLVGFLTFNIGSGGPRKNGIGLFAAALGTFPIVTFLATSRFMVNQFGYLGGGYRRCFLLPVAPAVVLQTGSYASLLLGAAFIPVAGAAWVAFAPVPFDARQVIMLLTSATAGLFLFHGLGLWATIYGPRRGNYNQSLGNDLSLFGNIVLIGGVLGCILGPRVLKTFAPAAFDPANWWMWLAWPVAAAVFYSASLRAASALVTQKREVLMAVVEGRA